MAKLQARDARDGMVDSFLGPAESCKKYVAARWAIRQTGVVRARCEEFDPSDLAGTAEVHRADPDTGADVVTPAGGRRPSQTDESVGR